MSPAERTFWNIALSLGALVSVAMVLFMAFTYGMGMGAFSSAAYARFERLTTPVCVFSLGWVPVALLGVVLGKLRAWGLKPYLVLAVGCVLPPVVFVACTAVLY